MTFRSAVITGQARNLKRIQLFTRGSYRAYTWGVDVIIEGVDSRLGTLDEIMEVMAEHCYTVKEI